MPTVVVGAAVSAVAAGSWIAGSTLVIGFSLSTFAGSMILGGLSYALTPKPKKPGVTQIEDQGSTVAVRQSDMTRQHVRGHTRITRGFAHLWSTGQNGELHMFLILCEGGPNGLRAIPEVWVNDYSIPADHIDIDGNVTQGRYAGNLTVRKHLGSYDQVADELAIENLEDWTETDTLSGIAYLYLILKKNEKVFPTGVPNFSAVVEGPELYDPRAMNSSGLSWSTNIALYARDYKTNAEYGFGANDADIDDVNIAAQANICDEIVTVTDEHNEVSSIDVSTNIITLKGDILKLLYGDRVRIQSSGEYPGGIGSGDVLYVIPYQVKDTPRILLAQTLEDAMAKNAIDISSIGSGTITVIKTGEPRYHGSGIIDTEVNLSENLNNICSSMAGRAINIGGFWTLLAGAWRTPVMPLGIGDTRSGIGMKRGLPMSESFNVVKGLFISPLSFYQETDYPSARYQTFIDQDLIENARELPLPFTDRPTTAQRIAKIELFRARQDIVFNCDFSAKTYRLQPGDNVSMDIDYLGWQDKLFEVTQFAFDIRDNALISRMTLRETAEEIFDWSEGEAITFDPAPNTNLPDPFTVDVVEGFSLDSIPVFTQDEDRIFNVVASWDLHDNQLVQNGGWYEITYKVTTESDDQYKSAGTPGGKVDQIRIPALDPLKLYDVQIIAYNKLGVPSEPSTIYAFMVGSTVTTNTEDWENETLSRHLTDWETDSLSSEDWEA